MGSDLLTLPQGADGIRVLVVDDEAYVREVISRSLEANGYSCAQADNGLLAWQMLQKEDYALVVSDIMMPGLSGIELLEKVRERFDDVAVLLVTAVDDRETAVRAVRSGAYGYIVKPFSEDEICIGVAAALERRRLITAERELLEKTLQGSIKVLTEILSLVRPLAFSRASRLERYVNHIVTRLCLPDAWQFTLAAMLSQIGMVILSPDSLEKVYAGQPLSEGEKQMLATHPSVARGLLSNIPRMEIVGEMIEEQYQPFSAINGDDPRKWDRVILGAQILKVAGDFDELVSKGAPPARAISLLRRRPDEDAPALVEALEGLEAESDPVTVRAVKLLDIRIGMITAEEVRAKNGLLLVSTQQQVTLPVLERLRNFARQVGVVEPIRMFVPSRTLGGTSPKDHPRAPA